MYIPYAGVDGILALRLEKLTISNLKSYRLSQILVLKCPLISNPRYRSKIETEKALSVSFKLYVVYYRNPNKSVWIGNGKTS